MGHDFLRIRGEIFKPLGQWGKAKCQNGNPSKLSTTFLVLLTQSFIIARNWLSWLLHGWARYDNPNSNWRSHHFLGNVFWLLGQVKTQKRMPFYHAFMFGCFPRHFFSFTSELSGIQNFLCVKPFTFFVVTSFWSGWEIVFWWLSVVEFPFPHFAGFFSIVSKLKIIFF